MRYNRIHSVGMLNASLTDKKEVNEIKNITPTNLKKLLSLCVKHNGTKTFTDKQYAFLYGYMSGLQTAKGTKINNSRTRPNI